MSLNNEQRARIALKEAREAQQTALTFPLDYLLANRASTTSGVLAIGDPIPFDAVVDEATGVANIALDISTGRFTLQPGRYRLVGRCRIIVSALNTQWFDVTAAAFIGTGGAIDARAVPTSGPQPDAVAVLDVTVATEVELRVLSAVDNPQVLALMTATDLPQLCRRGKA